MNKPKCLYPECTDKPSKVNNKLGFCFRHGEWAVFLLWAIPRLQMAGDKNKTKSDLLWTPENEK